MNVSRLYIALLAVLLPPPITPAQDAAARRQEGSVIYDGVPEIPAAVRALLRPYQQIRSARFVAWQGGTGRLLVATRFGETNQYHIVSQPGSDRRQITFYEEPVGEGDFGRGAFSNLLLFEQDAAGSEKTQIMLFDLKAGSTRQLTDGAALYRSPTWSRTSGWFACTTTARNGRDWDIQLRRADEPAEPPLPLVEAGGEWTPLDWSPDDRLLLVRLWRAVSDTELYVVDRQTGARRRIDGDPADPSACHEALFSNTGTGIYYTSDRATEFKQLRYYDLEHGVSKTLVDNLAADVSDLALSHDGRLLAFTANEQGTSGLHLLNTRTLQLRRLTLPVGIIRSPRFSLDDARIAFTLTRADLPSDVYSYSFDGDRVDRWTFSETGGIPAERFAVPETATCSAFDQEPAGTPRRIPLLVWRPRAEGKHPVAVWFHGGPESQTRPDFDPFIQFLVNELSVAVVAPNVRGSTGYGKTYEKLDNAARRPDPVRDIGSVLDWIALQPNLDPARVMTIGGSYGGFMSLAAQVRYPERLRAGISRVGISNLVSFLENTSEYRRDRRRAEYGDERDPALRAVLDSVSALPQASRLVRPLLVGHGANDPRVPYSESLQIVNAARANGAPVWFFVATDEGHGFGRRSNRDAWDAVAAHFISTYLLEPPSAPPAADATPPPPAAPTAPPTPPSDAPSAFSSAGASP